MKRRFLNIIFSRANKIIMWQHINEISYFKTLYFFVQCKENYRNADIFYQEVLHTYQEGLLVQLLSF
jgi:hypothetical protein